MRHRAPCKFKEDKVRINEWDKAAIISNRMRDWLQVATNGLNASDRARARRNLRRLVQKYPESGWAELYDFLGIETPKEIAGAT